MKMSRPGKPSRLNALVKVVRLVGVEPTTYRLGGDRSIQVSYNRIYIKYIITNP